MNLTIPFNKDIKFNNNIAEVTSISLEHDYTVNDRELLGNFTVFGEYKTHEVSVNKEKFEYVLPFQVDLNNERIDRESIDFAIDDFTYEIIDNNTLRVNIEYKINAVELPLKAEVNKNDEEVIIDTLDNRNEEENVLEIDKDIDNKEDKVADENDTRQTNKEEDIVMNAELESDSFVTYNIHILKDNENIETVCSKYNASKEIIEEYNDISNLNIGDKIIIPQVDE